MNIFENLLILCQHVKLFQDFPCWCTHILLLTLCAYDLVRSYLKSAGIITLYKIIEDHPSWCHNKILSLDKLSVP